METMVAMVTAITVMVNTVTTGMVAKDLLIMDTESTVTRIMDTTDTAITITTNSTGSMSTGIIITGTKDTDTIKDTEGSMVMSTEAAIITVMVDITKVNTENSTKDTEDMIRDTGVPVTTEDITDITDMVDIMDNMVIMEMKGTTDTKGTKDITVAMVTNQ